MAIPLRYPLVEAVTAGLFVVVGAKVGREAALWPALALAVVLVAAAFRRDRAALAMGLAGLVTMLLAGAAWVAAVAVPNWERFRTALRIWPTVDYLDSPAVVAGRLGRYLTDSDQALVRSLPLLLAAAVGLAALVRSWPRLAPAARDTLVMGGLWGIGLWLAVAMADYLPTHYTAPNRYVVPALPGLAVLAGFGLADLAALAGRARDPGWAGRRAGLVGVALGLAVTLPGVVVYLDGALGSGRSRELGQRVLAASLPEDAVVYGAYAPTLLFDTGLSTLTPWPTADANVRDPVGRLGVTHVLVGGAPADPTAQVPTIVDQGAITLLARVPWDRQELSLYALAPRGGRAVSPVALRSDYHPDAGWSHRS
jgi:hypothetical protein